MAEWQQDAEWLEEVAGLAGVEPDALVKAYRSRPDARRHDLDPIQLSAAAQADGSVRPQASLSFDLLRQIAGVSDVIGAIISTRVTQMCAFARPQRSPYEPGFQIRMRDRKAPPTSRQQKRIAQVAMWLEACGDPSIHADPFNTHFEGFTAQIMRDSLELDWCAWENVPTRGGGLAGFVPVDAATIRKAHPEKRDIKQGRLIPGDLRYVQLVNDKIVEEFKPGELVVGVRRPRTSLWVMGYGYPEIEQVLRKIIQLMLAETYNSGNFTQGIHARGLLTVKSAMGAKDWNRFLRETRAMLSGAQNANKLAMAQLDPNKDEKIDFIDLFRNNKDMEYSQWTNWLLKVCCAVFCIDPAEIGFQFGNEGATSTLSERGPAERLAYSKEKGLAGLLAWYERLVNRAIVQRLDPELELVFLGLDGQTEQERGANEQREVSYVKTVNEVRAERDLPPLEGGDVILNAYFLQSQQAAQAPPPGEQGMDGDDAAGAGEQGAGAGQGTAPQGGGDDFDVDALLARSALTKKGGR